MDQAEVFLVFIHRWILFVTGGQKYTRAGTDLTRML